MHPGRRSLGRIETALHRERHQHRYQHQDGRNRSPMHTIQNSPSSVGKSGATHPSPPPPASCLIGTSGPVLRERSPRSQHIRLKTDQGDIKGHVSKVQGRTVKVTPHSQFTAKITSVVTIGKEELNGAETSRANLILNTFKGYDNLLSSPFIRRIFFPGYPLHTLKWPTLPTSQPRINFTYRPLNSSQQKAVERCLSNKEEDRHVIIVVSSPPPVFCLVS